MSTLSPAVLLASRPDEVQRFLRHASGRRSPSRRNILVALASVLLFAVFLPGAALIVVRNSGRYELHELAMVVLFGMGGVVLGWYSAAYQLASYRLTADHVEARSIFPGASWVLRSHHIRTIKLVHGRAGRNLVFFDRQGTRRAVPLLSPFDMLTDRYEPPPPRQVPR